MLFIAPLPFIAPLAHCLIATLLLSPPQATRPAGSAAIIGRVVDGGAADQRIGGVTVTIAGGGLPAAEKTVTDADGQFVFRALPAGSYSLGVKRGGYLDGSFGQQRPGGPSRSLILSDGERREDINVRMFKPSAITGVVTDEANEPVVKVEVRAYQRTFMSGRAVLGLIGTDLTDDRGAYRIGRLLPGDYVIAVPLAAGSPPPGAIVDEVMVRDGGSSAAHLPPSDGKQRKFPTTYYPTGQTAAQATIITLGIGDARRNADLQLRPLKALNISGAVQMATGLARGVSLELVTAGEDDIGGSRPTATAITGEGGTFAFPAIPVGQYVLRAQVRPSRTSSLDDVTQWAEQAIVLDDKDVSDMTLFMRGGSTVSGRIEFDGSSEDNSGTNSGFAIVLDPANVRYASTPLPAATIDPARKTFSFANVMPGRYLIRVKNPGTRAVKSVTYQGRDVSQWPFTVDASDASGMILTLSDRAPVLTGTVSGSAEIGDATVLMFPLDPQRWLDFGMTPMAPRLIDVTTRGTFEVRTIPAGDYLLVAFDQNTTIDWHNPDFLRKASGLATQVRLTDGEATSIDLRVVSIK